MKREYAINYLRSSGMTEEQIDEVTDAFEQRWIPVSERLPEEDTDVLIAYRYKDGEGDIHHVHINITSYGTVCFGGSSIYTLKGWRQPFEYFHDHYEVIAWMPLPKPCKAESEDKE
jgi:hypothetical protein